MTSRYWSEGTQNAHKENDTMSVKTTCQGVFFGIEAFFRTEPRLHNSIPRFQFFRVPNTPVSEFLILNRSGSAAQSGSEMNRSGSLRTYLEAFLF